MDQAAAQWRKSSHSGHEGGQCVEVADLTGSVGVRDSKAPDRGRLVLDGREWRSFVRSVRELAA
ncbi:DUF397 domain-containing protein [Actinomadura harenae]|uniref:DUF397 domain-containing protein n=1 Tax=Actinomadura harenae TaxID=2483351 RepID=UPI001F37BE64|nr:DUF397 domain-containing protein [Actinomadura harenae]